jgi:hypothetical protein
LGTTETPQPSMTSGRGVVDRYQLRSFSSLDEALAHL